MERYKHPKHDTAIYRQYRRGEKYSFIAFTAKVLPFTLHITNFNRILCGTLRLIGPPGSARLSRLISTTNGNQFREQFMVLVSVAT
ncbi:hypothetical protein ACLOJK_033522 [Asimina triloba]